MAYPLKFKAKNVNGKNFMSAVCNIFERRNGSQGFVGSCNIGGQDYLLSVFIGGNGFLTRGGKPIAGSVKFTKIRPDGSNYQGPYNPNYGQPYGPMRQNGGY